MLACKRTALIVVGLILLSLAFLLAGYNLWYDHRAADNVCDALGALRKKVYQHDNFVVSDSLKIPDYIMYPDMNMPTVEFDNRQYIGILKISSVSLELPVLNQWNNNDMQIAPCRYAGSIYKNNLVIAAHNYRSHFGRLKEVAIRDDVSFTDSAGNVFFTRWPI